ncbi:MAG: hypothetical protein EBV76_11295 [Gammaproteobacteria bacterium]|nr:hypothetical protein [Gammaproteobacteria bacterium]
MLFILRKLIFVSSNLFVVLCKRFIKSRFNLIEEFFAIWRFLEKILKLLTSFCFSKFMHQHIEQSWIAIDGFCNLVCIFTQDTLKIFATTRNDSAKNILYKFETLSSSGSLCHEIHQVINFVAEYFFGDLLHVWLKRFHRRLWWSERIILSSRHNLLG